MPDNMQSVSSYSEFINKIKGQKKSYLLLYKSGSDQSICAVDNLNKLSDTDNKVKVYSADVTDVRDIHEKYSITSVPSLLVFENENFINVVKGCQESHFYKDIIENKVYKASSESKSGKRVTVYTTPTCSWCNTLKSWLKNNSINFSEVDVSKDEKAAQDMVKRSGQQGVPQTDINGQMIVGFNQQKLKELLQIN